jgi:hypothetical protein
MRVEQFLREGVEHHLTRYSPGPIWTFVSGFFSPILGPFTILVRLFSAKSKINPGIYLLMLVALVAGSVYLGTVVWAEYSFFLELNELSQYEAMQLPGDPEVHRSVVIASFWSKYVIVYFMFMLYGFRNRYSKDGRIPRRARYKYSKEAHFTEKEYVEAAKILEKFTTRTYKSAIKKYPQKLIDLLLIADGLWVFEGKVKRMVSIRSIKEDRAAGPDDD